jgi:hypothetical protein
MISCDAGKTVVSWPTLAARHAPEAKAHEALH